MTLDISINYRQSERKRGMRRKKRMNVQFTRWFLLFPVLSVTLYVDLGIEPTLNAMCCQLADHLSINSSPKVAFNDDQKPTHALTNISSLRLI